MFRLRSNCSVRPVDPSVFTELMESKPGIEENCLSRGVATVEDMVCGSAPGRPALTETAGESILGSSLTGNATYATMPKMAIAAINKLVAIGRRMKGSQMFIATP